MRKMHRDYNFKVQPRIRFLDKEGIRVLHLAALEILEKTGILVYHEEALELLASTGCKVFEKNRVHIPPRLVEEAVRSAPEKITIYNRKGEPTMFLQDRKSYWGTGSDTPFILDSSTDERRKTSLEDVKKVSIIVDYLDNLDFLMSMGVAHELPQSVADKHHFFIMASHTSKPIVFTASSRENLIDIYQMACDISGGESSFQQRPFILHYTEPIAPLIHPKDSLEKMLFCVEKGIPVVYSSATTAGQNGPATLAGSLALSSARILSGIVIGQLKRKGAKMVASMHASSMDPRSAIHTYASPEHVICQAVARDLAHYYRLPTFGRAGCTDSKILDQQTAFEAGYEILMQALCGENLIHDVGYIESGLTASWDSLVMCNEFIGTAKRVVRGFQLNKETLALDLINRVGPAGHFLAEVHTVKHFRKEFWIPQLLDRDNFQNWQKKGKTTLLDRVKVEVRNILKTHRPQPLNLELIRNLKELAEKDNSKNK